MYIKSLFCVKDNKNLGNQARRGEGRGGEVEQTTHLSFSLSSPRPVLQSPSPPLPRSSPPYCECFSCCPQALRPLTPSCAVCAGVRSPSGCCTKATTCQHSFFLVSRPDPSRPVPLPSPPSLCITINYAEKRDIPCNCRFFSLFFLFYPKIIKKYNT